MLVKANFGCGSIQPPGWSNVDKEDLGQQFVGTSADLPSNYFDIIVAHCVIQTIEYHDIIKQLDDLRRVMKEGAVLRISLPDIVRGFSEYQSGNINYFPNREPHLDDRFSAWLTWYSTTKSLLTPEALRFKLMAAGFAETRQVNFSHTYYSTAVIVELDTREHECYFIEARK